jgi:hypothetical protein
MTRPWTITIFETLRFCHSEQSEEPAVRWHRHHPHHLPCRSTRNSGTRNCFSWSIMGSVKRSAKRSIPAKLAKLLALATLLTTLATAQRAAHAAPRSDQAAARFAFAQNAHPSSFRRSSPRTSLPFPFLGDFSLDDLYSSGYPVASQPPVILLQAMRALSSSSESQAQPSNSRKPSSSTQPVMIELQNGRYVRLSSTAANGEVLPQSIQAQPAKLTRPTFNRPAASNSIAQTPALTPATLVFRDGHTEEVRDYAIANGTLYARGDYYTDGYWNKNIALAALNIPETRQANSARNVSFVLPSSPNEVITRP